MHLPIQNTITISQHGISINGVDLLVEKGSLITTGEQNSNELNKVMLTLIPTKIIIENDHEDQ